MANLINSIGRDQFHQTNIAERSHFYSFKLNVCDPPTPDFRLDLVMIENVNTWMYLYSVGYASASTKIH